MTMFSKLEEEINFIKRYLLVLRTIRDNEPIGIQKISKTTRLPPHQTRYSMRVLEDKGLIFPTRRGAKLSEEGKMMIRTFNRELKKIIIQLKEITL